jgi:hypothetical protein
MHTHEKRFSLDAAKRPTVIAQVAVILPSSALGCRITARIEA